jgi:putative N6-adenine-specific DNA methylase
MAYIGKTIAGLEEVLEKELISLGATDTKRITRAVSFEGDKTLLYRVNYACRTALRFLQPFASFTVETQDDFYKKVYELDWPSILSEEMTFAIDAVVSYTVYTNSMYVAQRAKDAIVDKIRDATGTRPSVDTENPDLRINVHLYKDLCSVSLDSSGEPLFKRGYRIKAGEAPINEVLAAGMIKLSGWNGETALVDPMCGSGTILIEAAFHAGNYPGGYLRQEYGFMHWKDYDAAVCSRVVHEENKKIRPVKVKIEGSDQSRFAVQLARQNILAAGFGDIIGVEKSTFEDLAPPAKAATIITNPPYDERLKLDDSAAFYKMMGDTLKWKFPGYTAWIISGDLEGVKHLGLKPSKKYTLYNGPLECRFLRYDLFKGSHKEYKTSLKS